MFLQKKLFEIILGISSFSNIFGTYYIKILIRCFIKRNINCLIRQIRYLIHEKIEIYLINLID